MISIRNDVVGGFDSFVAAQKAAPGECKLTLVQFDNEYEVVWNARDIKDVPSIDAFYRPRGSTALLDAVGRAINTVGDDLAKRPEAERPGKVIIVVITDGHENASKEFTKKQIADMIKLQRESYSWEFTFIGANMDAFAEAGGMGIPTSGALGYVSSAAGAKGMFRAVSASVLRGRGGQSMAYSVAERKAAEGEGEKKP
jgi:hypothetical protein